MIVGVLGAIALIGLVWIALGFLAIASFLALLPYLGGVGAAALIGVILLLIVLIIGLIAAQRIEAIKRRALRSGLASSGVVSAVLGLALKRPLMALGVGGVAAALFMRSRSGGSK